MSSVLSNNSAAFSNISATTAAFTLTGGKFGVCVIGSSFGTVTLQALAGDGSTWVTALTAFSANGYAAVDLPPGQYRFAVSGTTGVYANVTPIAAGRA